MRVGGFVMLAMAAWQLIENFVLSFWLQLDSNKGETFGFAAFDALLGVAMLQGSDAARKVVLVLTGLASLAGGLLLFGLSLTDFWHLWPILASALASTVGVFMLTLLREASVPSLALGLILVVGGWVGSVASAVVLVGSVDIATIQMLREWSSPERSFKGEEFELKVPARWVVLKPGNPVEGSQPALATLANTEMLCLAQVFREVRSFTSTDNLEIYLDALAKAKAPDAPGLEMLSRADTRIGAAAARRMKVAWKAEAAAFVGYFTAWRDADVFYHVFLKGPAVVTKKIEQELDALERSVLFTAPRSLFIRDVAPTIRAACPLLTDTAVLEVARAIPKDSPPETYCRAGYRFALSGQPGMNSESQGNLRALMRKLFDAIPRAQMPTFGAQVERLLAGGTLSPAEDKQLTTSIRAGMGNLPPAVQDDLRRYYGMAINMGMFTGKFK